MSRDATWHRLFLICIVGEGDDVVWLCAFVHTDDDTHRLAEYPSARQVGGNVAYTVVDVSFYVIKLFVDNNGWHISRPTPSNRDILSQRSFRTALSRSIVVVYITM